MGYLYNVQLPNRSLPGNLDDPRKQRSGLGYLNAILTSKEPVLILVFNGNPNKYSAMHKAR